MAELRVGTPADIVVSADAESRQTYYQIAAIASAVTASYFVVAQFSAVTPAGIMYIRPGALFQFIVFRNVFVALLFFVSGRVRWWILAGSMAALNILAGGTMLSLLLSRHGFHGRIAFWIIGYAWLENAGYAAAWYAGAGLVPALFSVLLIVAAGAIESMGIIFRI